MDILVIGGGFVGQLIQLVVPYARVLDWRPTAPANHLETRMGPQYLWEPIPGIPNREFGVTTLVDGKPPTDDAILAYKRKIGKEDDQGDWGLQFRHKSTGWEAALPVPRVEYGKRVERINLVTQWLRLADGPVIPYDVLVSTIPLPFLLGLIEIHHDPFKQDPIYMYYGPSERTVDGMELNYQSRTDDPVYRITTASQTSFYESLSPLPGGKRILPGKIHHHPESEDILTYLESKKCFCFGRFARWRPDELAHESYRDIAKWAEFL